MDKLKDYLEMPWDKLKVELCKEIQEALLDKGQWWGHETDSTQGKHRCVRCHKTWDAYSHPTEIGACPVPPPITAPAEVVAKRLLGQVQGLQVLRVLRSLDIGLMDDAWLWMLQATSEQQIAICLKAIELEALGEIEE